jgi:hypothetical protein
MNPVMLLVIVGLSLLLYRKVMNYRLEDQETA